MKQTNITETEIFNTLNFSIMNEIKNFSFIFSHFLLYLVCIQASSQDTMTDTQEPNNTFLAATADSQSMEFLFPKLFEDVQSFGGIHNIGNFLDGEPFVRQFDNDGAFGAAGVSWWPPLNQGLYCNNFVRVVQRAEFGFPYLITYKQRYIDEIYDVQVQTNIVYVEGIRHFDHSSCTFTGPRRNLKMDIYSPVETNIPEGGRPVIVFIHGGGFYAGNRSQMQWWCREYAKKGYVAVTISYDQGWCPGPDVICPDSTNIDETIYRTYQSAMAAVIFLKTNADTLGINPNLVFLAGWSAGAITALNVAYWDIDEIPAWLIDDLGGPYLRGRETVWGIPTTIPII